MQYIPAGGLRADQLLMDMASVIDLHMVGFAIVPELLPLGFDLFEIVFHFYCCF